MNSVFSKKEQWGVANNEDPFSENLKVRQKSIFSKTLGNSITYCYEMIFCGFCTDLKVQKMLKDMVSIFMLHFVRRFHEKYW